MNRAFLVAQREFLENVRTKGFWIGILMMPLMLILFATIPFVVESTRAAKTFTVIDRSGWLLGEIRRQIDVEDLATLIRQIDMAKSLPASLQPLKEFANDLDLAQQQAMAAAVFDPSAPVAASLPAAARRFLEQEAGKVANEWRNLSPAAKADLLPGISTNQFALVHRENSAEHLNHLVQKGELFAYFVIGPDPVQGDDGFRYVSNNLTDRDLVNWFSGFANERIRARRLDEAGIDDRTANWISETAGFEGIQISSEGIEEEVQADDVVRQWVPVVFVYLLWISILINTQMLLTSTIEEKSNKLVEVLLSSISAIELMAGKILGIAVTGLAIIAAWELMGAFFFIALPSLTGLPIPYDITSVVSDPVYLGSFLVYFI
ncbi:MAG: ABC transporter permease, partial [Pseudomonadales bacterium]|nr:ABC transporter permease [Pseudomonadales bacterium]